MAYLPAKSPYPLCIILLQNTHEVLRHALHVRAALLQPPPSSAQGKASAVGSSKKPEEEESAEKAVEVRFEITKIETSIMAPNKARAEMHSSPPPSPSPPEPLTPAAAQTTPNASAQPAAFLAIFQRSLLAAKKIICLPNKRSSAATARAEEFAAAKAPSMRIQVFFNSLQEDGLVIDIFRPLFSGIATACVHRSTFFFNIVTILFLSFLEMQIGELDRTLVGRRGGSCSFTLDQAQLAGRFILALEEKSGGRGGSGVQESANETSGGSGGSSIHSNGASAQGSATAALVIHAGDVAALAVDSTPRSATRTATLSTLSSNSSGDGNTITVTLLVTAFVSASPWESGTASAAVAAASASSATARAYDCLLRAALEANRTHGYQSGYSPNQDVLSQWAWLLDHYAREYVIDRVYRTLRLLHYLVDDAVYTYPYLNGMCLKENREIRP